CQENTGAIRKLEGIVMHPRLVFVDLPKDRRPEVYRFRSPRGEAKGGGGAFHLLGKSKLCSRKNAHRRCRILRRSKPSSTRVKVDCPKLVTDLGRPRFDVVETEVTHGRGTPRCRRAPVLSFYQNRHRVPIAQGVGGRCAARGARSSGVWATVARSSQEYSSRQSGLCS